MNKNIIRLAIALPILLGAIVLVLKLTGTSSPGKQEVTPAPANAVSVPSAPKRVTSDTPSGQNQAPDPTPALRDDDPIGDIRLEGQVIDENGDAVDGAIVVLGSAPPKTTTSEQDGSFAFDDLVSRRYPVHARSETLVGGPVMVTLSENSDPVVVRMRPGGGIAVEVVDSANQPIPGATVTVPSMESIQETTNENGIATIRNLPPGQTIVAAQAPGFAKGHSLAPVPRAADVVGQQRITLVAGTLLAGTVVDHKGKPVKDAKVISRSSGGFLRLQSAKHDGVSTDDKGNFQLLVAQGGVQLVAMHENHPATTSERIVVGDSDIRGVEVALREGATVAGSVVSLSGEPVPWPTVRVVALSVGGSGTHRQTIGDKEGRFEMKGLPREKLKAHASSEEASSEGVDVDTRQKAVTKGLEIPLGVTGTLAGVVVDENGKPVAEAQVQAAPDFWEGADIDQLRVRGPAFATSAGDGSFTIRGLPDSKFTVSASRGRQQARSFGRGEHAKTGETNVRVVLATPSTIEGKVQMSDGSTPELATVSIGWGAGVPAVEGKFTIRDVAPGTYELSVRGPQFATAYVPNIEVKSGMRHDLGSISVERGRVLKGTITNSAGQAVAGADIVMGTQIISDGTSLTPKNFGEGMDQRFGLRRAVSDDSGQFELYGLGTGTSTLAADHPEQGRALSVEVPKGREDLNIDMKLRDVGSVRGTVKVNGEPVANVQVLIAATEGAAHIVVVPSDERGAFYAERVMAGEQKVSAMLNVAGAGSMTATIVEVKANSEVEAKLAIEEGSVTLAIKIQGKVGDEDAQIDAAQVFLFKGAVDIKTGGELNALFLTAAADAKMAFALGGQEAKFDKIVSGPHSVCVIPINGDMNDPAFAQKLQRNVGDLAVYCGPVKIAEAPEQQAHTAVVPPMQPLPDDE